jgi:4a-hydroxytetrahydrobiopterin dehydratase
MNPRDRKCVPCEGDAEPLSKKDTKLLLAQVEGWSERGQKLHKTRTFSDFREAMAFVGRVAALAEAEGHHPDFCVHYNRVDFTVDARDQGPSENDFILRRRLTPW